MGNNPSRHQNACTIPNNTNYSNDNEYYNNEYNEYNEFEYECTQMIRNIPCLSFFCPIPSSSGNIRRQRGDNNNSNVKTNGTLGSPLQDSPSSLKYRRNQRSKANGYHSNNNGYNNERGLYDGLEVEDHHQQQQQQQQQQQRYTNNDHYPHQDERFSKENQSTSIIHDGVDGEKEFMKKYEMCEVLGVGSTSICHRCINKYNGISFACKIIDKQQIEQQFAGMMDQFHTEIEALRKLHHPNIIKLYDVFMTRNKMIIVMELMAGGELFDYVVQKGTLTEAEASVIVRMVTSALVYMHESNIVHRDLKPENLLLKNKPNSIYDLEVKIIDFGLSKSMNNGNLAGTFLGTRGYLAPEMLQRRQYSRAVDAWALGVIVFVLLCGCLPFDDDSSTIFSDDVLKSKFKLRFPRWACNLSPSAKDLLSKLLDVDSRTRITAEEALKHPWICGTTAPKDSMLHSPGRIILTPGKKATPTNIAAANRTQMNEMIKNRARENSVTRTRDNSNPRPQRQLVRKKSI